MLRALAQAYVVSKGGIFLKGYMRRGDPSPPCTARDCVLTPVFPFPFQCRAVSRQDVLEKIPEGGLGHVCLTYDCDLLARAGPL